MGSARTAIFALLVGLFGPVGAARAQSTVPDRQIPPSVLTEVDLLENRFAIALASDCDPKRCYSTGCSYVDHAVADRPRRRSMPGLGDEYGPGSTDAQEYLTRARCGFAHEGSIEAEDIQALALRLQAKVSTGWAVVSVTHKELEPLAPYLREAPQPDPPPEAEEPVAPSPPPEWSMALAGRELWSTLLPHFYWMIAVVLLTLAGMLLIWAWRRVGRESIEDQMLLAELARGEGGPLPEGEAAAAEGDDEAAFVVQQDAAWAERIEALDPEAPDRELQALIRELLRARDLPLLAKAVLRFPEKFRAAFPSGGEIASAKLELAEYLKTVDADALPDDADFFRSLNRHALAAAVASQSDAEVVRGLREEFGASGLAALIGTLTPRPSALLFALAPTDEQHELVRLLVPQQVAAMADGLLRSNRMDPAETAYLFAVISALRADQPPPAAPPGAISDRGAEFDAAGAVSVLLENVNPARRSALFGEALDRGNGSLPSWYRGILVADLLFELSDESRADLMLEVDVETLAAWLSVLDPDTRERLLTGVPAKLRNSVAASSSFASRSRQLALAERGRRDLARGFQQQLARENLPFEAVVTPQARGA